MRTQRKFNERIECRAEDTLRRDCERLAADDRRPLATWVRNQLEDVVASKRADHSEREPR